MKPLIVVPFFDVLLKGLARGQERASGIRISRGLIAILDQHMHVQIDLCGTWCEWCVCGVSGVCVVCVACVCVWCACGVCVCAWCVWCLMVCVVFSGV